MRARDKSEILACRRCWNGIERFDEVKYALLRPDGQIAIVPKTGKGPRVARSQ